MSNAFNTFDVLSRGLGFNISASTIMKTLFPFLAASLCSTSPLGRRNQDSDIFSLFVFGDSYSSTTFNISSPPPSRSQPLGFPPLGTSPDDLLGNPLIANTSTANGPNWVEFLTTKFNTTTTLTYDFAISGASIPDGFTDQILDVYEPKYSGSEFSSEKSVFASWVGINDINWCSLLFTRTPEVPFAECLPPRMSEYFELMDNLYQTGARNFFFVNMPPLQRAPMVFEAGQTIVDNYVEGVALFNGNLLPRYVENFTASHEGVETIIYDAHSFFGEILDHANEYGFKDNRCYSCIGCRNVTGCFWSNDYHPVWQVHERLARDMVANLTAVGWPVPEQED